MADEDHQEPLQPPRINNSVKLPPFWAGNASSWFSTIEGSFELRGVTSQRAMFFNALQALPEFTITLIADLVETRPLPENPFDVLRARLLTAHQLTDNQRAEIGSAHV